MMTPEHRKWHEFLDRLEGPEGCDFREKDGELCWSCAAGEDKTFTRAILKAMGFTDKAIHASCRYFSRHSGHCDCEILFNLEYMRWPSDPERRLLKHMSDEALGKIAKHDFADAECGDFVGRIICIALTQRNRYDLARVLLNCDEDQ